MTELKPTRISSGLRHRPNNGPRWYRFVRRVQQTADGCWVWTGRSRLWDNEREQSILPQVVSHEIFIGPLPNDLIRIERTCGNLRCVHPCHLDVRIPADTCSFDGCDSFVYLSGLRLCRGHAKQRELGKPLTPLKRYHRQRDGQKYCKMCDTWKPVTEFRRTKKARGTSDRSTYCMPCMRVYETARRFDIKSDTARLLLDATNCGVCGVELTDGRQGPTSRNIDHCHTSGDVRDVLCGRCNRTLGQAQDDPAILRALADYIERHASAAESAA